MSEDRASRNQVFGSAAMAQDGIPARDVMKDDFGWEVPVESVPVPSGGKIYAPSTNLHGVSTIDIKAMTAQEEDILTSRALIRKGIVLSKLIESCVIDKNIDTRHMVAGDRNALMIAIRVTGYGSEYKTDITCPSCSHRQPYEFDLGELAIVPLEIDPVTPGENRFSYTLPVTKKKVEFKFLTGVDEEEMTAEAEKMRQIMPDREITNNVTRNLEKSILSIDGVTDRVKITLFIKQMPARDSRMLRQYMERNEPGIDMTTTMGCSNCGTSSSVQLPLGTGFFGLGTEYREVFLEQFFVLQYYMGVSYSDCRKMPVRYRTWFIERIVKEIKKTGTSKSQADNDPASRQMRGMARDNVPSKLRRFT